MSRRRWGDQLREHWPSTLVARTEVPKFCGGAISSGYLANEDSAGRGPRGAFRLGKRVVYPIDNLIEWLEERVKSL